MGLDERGRVVGRAVVHDDDLDELEAGRSGFPLRLGLEDLEEDRQAPRLVEDRDHERERAGFVCPGLQVRRQ
jgi:hypothetical protein